jgi:hypothetical protein
MDRSWIWPAILGSAVVACLRPVKDDDLEDDDDDAVFKPDRHPDTGDTSSPSDDGGGEDVTMQDLAAAICLMYDDCGLVTYYWGSMEACVDYVLSYYTSMGCEVGPDAEACIEEVETMLCRYYSYGGTGACYYALDCSGGYYYYYDYGYYDY